MTVTSYGHGIYCYRCVDVHASTSDCDHDLGDKAGVERVDGGYAAQPNDMGHYSPHIYMEIDGMEMCSDCQRVKIPEEMVPESKR